jgi:hypothetical protein
MTKQEFKRIYTTSQEQQVLSPEEQEQAIVALGGIAYGTDRRLATTKQCAWWVRYHCLFINGSWDMQELENHQIYFRKVDLLD